MNVIRKMIFGVLIGTLVDPCSAQVKQQSGKIQESQRLGNELKSIVNDLPGTLASDESRYQLATTINLLLAKRIAAKPKGYEQNLKFQVEFNKTWGRFLETLESKAPVTLSEEDAKVFEALSIRAYERNQSQFRSFYESALSTDSQLKRMSIAGARKTLFQFSAWLYVNDRATWTTAFRLTFLWPFCMPADDADLNEKFIPRKKK